MTPNDHRQPRPDVDRGGPFPLFWSPITATGNPVADYFAVPGIIASRTPEPWPTRIVGRGVRAGHHPEEIYTGLDPGRRATPRTAGSWRSVTGHDPGQPVEFASAWNHGYGAAARPRGRRRSGKRRLEPSQNSQPPSRGFFLPSPHP